MTPGIALCHEWVTTWGGSEQVSREIAEALDIEDIYTYVADPAVTPKVFGQRRVHTSDLGKTRFAHDHWQWLLPLMPRWWRNLDLSSYEVVVTCSHSAVNSVRVHGGAVLISYCCTPMRYAWNWRTELRRLPFALRPILPVAAIGLRSADKRRAQHVDLFLADSRNVAARIRSVYRKPSIVMYPPVDTNYFTPSNDQPREDFLLFAGRLVAYKRPDLVVRAATRERIPLVIAGSGPELPALRRLAGPTVDFLIEPTDAQLLDLYRRARALVFPGIEDFGIVPVEAQSCGTPVIAYAAGGVLETVVDGITGMLYDDASIDGLICALDRFDASAMQPNVIRHHAERFSRAAFDERMRTIVIPIASAPADRRRSVVNDLLKEHGSVQ